MQTEKKEIKVNKNTFTPNKNFEARFEEVAAS